MPRRRRDGRKDFAASQADDQPFFWQALGLIFLSPAQVGYGDKWRSE